MSWIQALVLGVLQGATEFLPVSSSGHLALAQWLWPGAAPASQSLLFDVIVHLGTLGAILWVLRARVARLILAAVSIAPGVRIESDPADVRWLALLVLASIPTALIGLSLRDVVAQAHDRPVWIGACLLVTAVLLFVSERAGRRTRAADSLGVLDAVLIGIAQGLAVFPGVSRSGATIATALLRDVEATAAVQFSVLLSIPAILGANLLEIAKAGPEVLSASAVPLAIGFAAAFVTGAVALEALQWVVQRRKLQPFAVYCGLVGVGAIALGLSTGTV